MTLICDRLLANIVLSLQHQNDSIGVYIIIGKVNEPWEVKVSAKTFRESRSKLKTDFVKQICKCVNILIITAVMH